MVILRLRDPNGNMLLVNMDKIAGVTVVDGQTRLYEPNTRAEECWRCRETVEEIEEQLRMMGC